MGMVTEVNIEGAVITAEVRGSGRNNYQQVLQFPSFNKQEKQRIVTLIEDNPYYLSQLLNFKLPPELFAEVSKQKIKLFPEKWSDLKKTKCSCPDRAVPCKHLAAVIFMISTKIDQNPFLVFEL